MSWARAAALTSVMVLIQGINADTLTVQIWLGASSAGACDAAAPTASLPITYTTGVCQTITGVLPLNIKVLPATATSNKTLAIYADAACTVQVAPVELPGNCQQTGCFPLPAGLPAGMARVVDGCTTPTPTPPANGTILLAAQECESEDVLRREAIWINFLIVLAGLVIAVCGIVPIILCCPIPPAFLQKTGIFFWIHLLFHTATVGLTVAATTIDEMYKIAVSITGLWKMNVKVNFWRVIIDATSLSALTNPFSESVDTNCCTQVVLGQQIVQLAVLGEGSCAELRVVQSASILIIALSFASVIALIAQRWCSFHLGGYVGRLVFGWSTIYSIISVSLTQDLRNSFNDALPQAIFTIDDSFSYTTGFYINIAAMAVKCVALLLVIYEVIFGHPCGDIAEDDTEGKEVYTEDPIDVSSLPDPNPAVHPDLNQRNTAGRVCCEFSDFEKREVV